MLAREDQRNALTRRMRYSINYNKGKNIATEHQQTGFKKINPFYHYSIMLLFYYTIRICQIQLQSTIGH